MLHFPISQADFRAAHFEKSPLLCKSALRDCMFAWCDLDAILDCIEPDERNLQLFNNGLVPQASYTRDAVELGKRRRRLDHLQFYDQLRSGVTLVLNRFEDHSRTAQQLCADVARYLELQTSANTYVSFGGRGTFGKHWDTHDVFAIQLLGRKRWQVFPPTFALPLSYQTSEGAPQDEIRQAALDVVLEPGDVLYVPRGWWHSVMPFDAGSCHVSVGTYAATVHDYLLWVCSQFLAQQRLARCAFPPAPADRAQLGDMLHQLREVALDAVVWRRFATELQLRERQHGEMNLALHLSSQALLTGEVELRLTTAHMPTLENQTLVVNGTAHRLEAAGLVIVAALRNCASLTFDALCERVGGVPRDVLSATVLNLARHEVLSLQQPRTQ